MSEMAPEPGEVEDCTLGLPGPAEPMPDVEYDEFTEINDEEDL